MNIRTLPVRSRDQSGAALIVVLILLLVMTLLGLASLRGTLMEERMSANMYDRSLAFQAAEAALREAEARLVLPAALAAFPTTGSACNNGLCPTPVPDPAVLDRAEDPNFQGWINATQVSEIAGTPEYFVEYMGLAPGWFGCDSLMPPSPSCMRPRYRITARSAAAGRATVVLQANFAGS